jgi:membrane fusion protein (multidrug efflux system)
VLDDNHVAHQREIKIKNELEDVYLIQDGLAATDKIILDGVQQVSEGDKVTAEFRAPEQVMDNQKYAAE